VVRINLLGKPNLMYSYFLTKVIHAASSCYSCNNCGTTWDISKVSIIQTSSSSDYCRVSINCIINHRIVSFIFKYRKQ